MYLTEFCIVTIPMLGTGDLKMSKIKSLPSGCSQCSWEEWDVNRCDMIEKCRALNTTQRKGKEFKSKSGGWCQG